jgi:hypothetical protein
MLLVCVCILARVIRHANTTFPAQHYIVIYGLSRSNIVFHITS